MAKSKAPRKQMKPVTRLIDPAEYARKKQFLESKLTSEEVDRHALLGRGFILLSFFLERHAKAQKAALLESS